MADRIAFSYSLTAFLVACVIDWRRTFASMSLRWSMDSAWRSSVDRLKFVVPELAIGLDLLISLQMEEDILSPVYRRHLNWFSHTSQKDFADLAWLGEWSASAFLLVGRACFMTMIDLIETTTADFGAFIMIQCMTAELASTSGSKCTNQWSQLKMCRSECTNQMSIKNAWTLQLRIICIGMNFSSASMWTHSLEFCASESRFVCPRTQWRALDTSLVVYSHLVLLFWRVVFWKNDF